MKTTNKFNLPDYVEAWLATDDYDHIPGTYSATTLLKPTRAIILSERHWNEMEQDIADTIAMRYGTAIHAAFEKVKLDPAVFSQEKRVFSSIGGVTISGKYDMLRTYPDGSVMLIDLKSTSVWKYVYEEFDEYLKQLSIYRWLLEQDGKKVRGAAEIMMIFTDWSKKAAKEDPSYPQSRIVIQPIPLWDSETTKKFILDKLEELVKGKELKDDDLPLCTDEDLWRKGDKWAVKAKPDSARAKAVLENLQAAETYVKENGGIIGYRPAKVKRCPDYCPCYPFCNQHKHLKEAGLIGE
jgi:hypothetical protein